MNTIYNKEKKKPKKLKIYYTKATIKKPKGFDCYLSTLGLQAPSAVTSQRSASGHQERLGAPFLNLPNKYSKLSRSKKTRLHGQSQSPLVSAKPPLLHSLGRKWIKNKKHQVISMKISKKFKVVRHMQQVARRCIRETNGRGKRFYDRNLSTDNQNTR